MKFTSVLLSVFGLVFLFGVLSVPTAYAATYYVDGAGLGGTCSDSNDGVALTTPWCTIQKAASTAVAGDVVNIRGGTYREIVSPSNSGSSGSLITYQKYLNETPVINGADLMTGWTSLANDESASASLFSDGFEANDSSFTGYSSAAADAGNTVTATSSVINNGLYAAASTFGGTNRNARLNKAVTANADVYARFFFRLNSSYGISQTNVGQVIFQSRVDSSTNRAQVLLVQSSPGNFNLLGKAANPAVGTAVTTFASTTIGSIVPNTWYQVELRYKGGDASTGGAQMWVNGTSAGSVYSYNTSTTTISRVELGGSTAGSGIPTAGSIMYMDDLRVGTSPIGAFTGGNPAIYKTAQTWTPVLVYQNGTALATSSSATLSSGSWYYDSTNHLIYARTTDDSSPNTKTIESTRRTAGFDVRSKSYLKFDGLSFKYNNSHGSFGAGISIATSTGNVIQNSSFTDLYGSGIYFVNTSTSTISSNTFLRNLRPFGGGILFEAGSNNNSILNNNITGSGFDGGNGIVLCGDDTCQNIGNHYNVISGNTFYNLFDSCVYLVSRSTHNTYENNICGLTYRHLNSVGGAAGGTGIHVSRGSNDALIRNNIFYDNEGSSIGVQSDTIGSTEITTTGSRVYNNVVYNGSTNTSAQGGISYQGTTTDNIARNNIVFQSHAYDLRVAVTQLGVLSDVDSDYNLFYSTIGTGIKWDGSTYSTLAALQGATGREMHSLSVDPQFVNASAHNFALLNTSPAIDAGTTVAAVISDILGVLRPQSLAYDMGAYEYGGSLPDTTAPVRSAGAPSGTLTVNTTSTTISLTTNETATCAYSTSSGTSFGSMTTFDSTGSTSHSSVVSGLSNGGSYVYYVKCRDGSSNTNTSDYSISFTVAADATSPTVSLDAPANASVLSGSSVSLSATASDDVSVAGVQFKLDGTTAIGAEDTSSPYSVTWDSTTVLDGSHTLAAVARDSSGNYATSTVITITVDNTAPVRSAGAPSGTLSFGTTDTTLSLTTDEAATCKYSASSGVAYASMSSFNSTGGTSHSTPASGLANGQSYIYYVKCLDSSSNVSLTDYTISFTVAADTTFPVAEITAPGNNDPVAGASVLISANASDDVGVSGIQFKLDGSTNIGAEDTSAPYSVTWDSTSVSDGVHTLIAVARDTSGNYATSSVTTITVDNTAPSISSVESIVTSTTETIINWLTNEAADAQVFFGLNTSYSLSTTLNSVLDLIHSFLLSGLTPNTTYHYQVVSKDVVSNSQSSSDYTFTTLAEPEPEPIPPATHGSGGGGSGSTGTTVTPVLPISTVPTVNPLPVPTTTTRITTTLAPGAQGTAVSQLQTLLASDPSLYPEGKITGFYGPLTTAAVTRFQLRYRLFTSDPLANGSVGSVGPATLAKLNEVFNNALSISVPTSVPSVSTGIDLTTGSKGGAVTALQTFLISQNKGKSAAELSTYGASGYFGSVTRRALAEYQLSAGITPATGYFGPKTRAYLAALGVSL